MTDDDGGWLPLSIVAPSRRFWRGVAMMFPVLGFGFVGFELGLMSADAVGVGGWSRILIGTLGALIPFALGAWVWVLLNPVPYVNFGRDLIRIGGRTVPVLDIVVARRVLLDGGTGHQTPRSPEELLGIRIAAQDGPSVSIPLWEGARGTVEHELRERLAEVIRRSDIRYPTSSYDPTGKFARYNFPENLDKEAALALVLGDADPSDPPVAGDEAPNRV